MDYEHGKHVESHALYFSLKLSQENEISIAQFMCDVAGSHGIWVSTA